MDNRSYKIERNTSAHSLKAIVISCLFVSVCWTPGGGVVCELMDIPFLIVENTCGTVDFIFMIIYIRN